MKRMYNVLIVDDEFLARLNIDQSMLDAWGVDINSLKGMTFKERAGNPPARIAETPSGMLNSVGQVDSLDDHFCGSSSGSLGSSGSGVAAASSQRKYHCQCQNHCNQFFHSFFLMSAR